MIANVVALVNTNKVWLINIDSLVPTCGQPKNQEGWIFTYFIPSAYPYLFVFYTWIELQ